MSRARLKVRQSFIAIGSNLGDRIANCFEAIGRLSCVRGINLTDISSFYETEPVDMESDNLFINAVCCIKTAMEPEVLLDILLDIEKRMGRDRSAGMDRTMDLDLLFMQGILAGHEDFASGQGLVLPHPRARERAFVLVPWAEIAPDLLVEPWGMTVKEMLKALKPGGPGVQRIPWDVAPGLPERTAP